MPEKTILWATVGRSTKLWILYPEDLELQAAALMHDIFEDTDLTYEDLVSEFSIDVANLIHEVTHERWTNNTGWYFPHLHYIFKHLKC
jgi:GTP pyrophosphokinase